MFSSTMQVIISTLCLCLLIAMILSAPTPQKNPKDVYEDNERVQIRVYRGPDNQDGNWAPWGYFVKQPVEDRHQQHAHKSSFIQYY